MRYEHIACGPFVNESEALAFRKVSGAINYQDGPSGDVFRILTNLQFALSAQGLPDDLDIVVCGSTGLQIIEVKHWDVPYLKGNPGVAQREADKLNQKVRRVAALRNNLPFVPFLSGKFLLTKCNEVPVGLRQVRGTLFYGLRECGEILELAELGKLTEEQARRIAFALWPYAKWALEPDLRRVGPASGLTRLSDPADRFHRVYEGQHSTQRDQIILHLYDLSATDEKNALEKARRAFTVLQRYQKSPYLPRLVDSFQELPDYPGVMYFFTHADETAPALSDVRSMPSWSVDQRLDFGTKALAALDELHNSGEGEGLLHRAINPDTLLVRADNRPLFSGWQWARLPDSITISTGVPVEPSDPFAAPEVLREGLAAADIRSDIFSICSSLTTTFESTGDQRAERALEVLRGGLEPEPEQRSSLAELGGLLATIPRKLSATPEPPISRWSDDYQVEMFSGMYRVVSRLPGGSLGYAFKVVRLNPDTSTEAETLVAKGCDDSKRGPQMLKAYGLVKAHSGRPGLSSVVEVARDWQESKPVALLQWVDGESLGYWAGLLSEYAAELGESDPEQLVLGWLAELCTGLGRLHAAGVVHGDISPNNVIVERASVRLTDFDLITEVGQAAIGLGTPPYSSVRLRRGEPVGPIDDMHALAASFFYALTARDPFMYNGVRHEERGLAWQQPERQRFPKLAEFLDHALSGAFANGAEALEALTALRQTEHDVVEMDTDKVPTALTPNQVNWLQQILKAYPGSPRWGNVETRGLDSDFARDTYVATELDNLLYEMVGGGHSSLVILCGNAGDGKTSILQHLAGRLGIADSASGSRVWESTLPSGVTVKANLDGAAAWQGRSADELLDEIFEPFQSGPPSHQLVHLVAVNDGRLLEWIEHHEGLAQGSTPLTEALAAALGGESSELPPHVRFIDLNARSLVGTIARQEEKASAGFINELLDRMVGGRNAAKIWQPCQTCSARERCAAWRSARVLADLDNDARDVNERLRSCLA